uniref:Interleukin n=1 Tax=Esox lucius TaxID=8010 RepID=A0A3P8Y4B1_ESOLU
MLSGQKTDLILAVLLLFFSATNMKRAGPYSRETILTLKYILDKPQEMESLECSLYTPTLDEYTQKCPMSTFSCYVNEVKVLVSETGRSPIKRLAEQLIQLNSTSKQQKESDACPCCESYSEQPPKVFLSTLRIILEKKNTAVQQKPRGTRNG